MNIVDTKKKKHQGGLDLALRDGGFPFPHQNMK